MFQDYVEVQEACQTQTNLPKQILEKRSNKVPGGLQRKDNENAKKGNILSVNVGRPREKTKNEITVKEIKETERS